MFPNEVIPSQIHRIYITGRLFFYDLTEKLPLKIFGIDQKNIEVSPGK